MQLGGTQLLWRTVSRLIPLSRSALDKQRRKQAIWRGFVESPRQTVACRREIVQAYVGRNKHSGSAGGQESRSLGRP